MVRITEFRITMPVSIDEYQRAQAFMKTKMQMENTTGHEGVEVLASQPFENEELGSGHFSHFIYHLQSKAPAWVRALAPSGALRMEEKNWNAYPHSKTELRCPYFSKFKITIESMHIADRGETENALNLPAEKLSLRKVDKVDIASVERDMWTRMIAKSGIDPSKYRSAKMDRGPLLPGWQESCEPVMTAYKLVTVDAPYWGFGKKMEQAVISGERALFLEAHRKQFGWIDEWSELSMDDVRRVERENIESLRKNLVLHNKVAPEAFDESAANGYHPDADVGDEGKEAPALSK